jgi:hypothetical protein
VGVCPNLCLEVLPYCTVLCADLCSVQLLKMHVPRLSQLCHVTKREFNANTTQVARLYIGLMRLVHRVWIVCNSFIFGEPGRCFLLPRSPQSLLDLLAWCTHLDSVMFLLHVDSMMGVA